MKGIILSAILFASITTSAMANETKNLELKGDFKTTTEMMNSIGAVFPKVHEILTDYFQANTCKEDFANRISTEDIKEFMQSYQYGVLVGLKYQEDPVNKSNYTALMSAYKAMNCGSEIAMVNYVSASSGITVEKNDKKTK